MSGKSKLYQTWMDIIEIIGPLNKWPNGMRTRFWNEDPNHWDRIMLSAFVYVNGLNPEILLDWHNIIIKDQSKIKHIATEC